MKFVRTIWSRIKRYVPKSWRQKIKEADSKEMMLLDNPESIYEKAYHIKDATWETVEMPEVWNMSKSYAFSMRHPAQDILRIPKVLVSPGSDIVIADNKIIWDKYYSSIFPYTLPLDSNLATIDANRVRIRNVDTIVPMDGECISMLGVFDDIWTHFIMQFLPKLYYAQEAGLLDKDITVIVPDYKDEQVKELVYNVLNKHKSCRVVVHERTHARVAYMCNTLYWIPTASAVSNDTIFPSLYHNIIPRKVMDVLHREAFELYKESSTSQVGEKIYLVRKNARFRNITNVDEVEQFFYDRGFAFIEPHKFSLAEKISIFKNAKIIAGSHSSAWSNAMFCDHAKGLMLTPISWTNDAFVGYNLADDECHVVMVPGSEGRYDNSQCDFTINLQDLEEAYNALINA